MAIIHEGCLRCPNCREYVIEAEPDEYPDGVDHDTPGADESPTPCSECAPQVQADEDAVFLTIVADWEDVRDSFGDTISPDMLPVVIRVAASDRNEALVVASQMLQSFYGPDVAGLHAKGLTAEDWFGLNGSDPLLRDRAVFRGRPLLENDDMVQVID